MGEKAAREDMMAAVRAVLTSTAEVDKYFNAADDDRNGKLSKDEAGKALRTCVTDMGLWLLVKKDWDLIVKDFMVKLDKNNDGFLSLHEFREGFEQAMISCDKATREGMMTAKEDTPRKSDEPLHKKMAKLWKIKVVQALPVRCCCPLMLHVSVFCAAM